jgi:VanZ family protein
MKIASFPSQALHRVRLHWRWLLTGLCAVGVIALTTLPRGSFVVQFVETFWKSGEVADAVGHAGLFASLTAVLYLSLRHALGGWRMSFGVALLLTLVIGVTAALLTELSQANTPGRTASLSDGLGNMLGVFIMATLISARRR